MNIALQYYSKSHVRYLFNSIFWRSGLDNWVDLISDKLHLFRYYNDNSVLVGQAVYNIPDPGGDIELTELNISLKPALGLINEIVGGTPTQFTVCDLIQWGVIEQAGAGTFNINGIPYNSRFSENKVKLEIPGKVSNLTMDNLAAQVITNADWSNSFVSLNNASVTSYVCMRMTLDVVMRRGNN